MQFIAKENLSTYFASNTDQAVVKTKSQILTVICPTAGGDTSWYFVFVHCFLLRRPQTYNTEG